MSGFVTQDDHRCSPSSVDSTVASRDPTESSLHFSTEESTTCSPPAVPTDGSSAPPSSQTSTSVPNLSTVEGSKTVAQRTAACRDQRPVESAADAMDAQRFASTLTTVPPHRAVVQSRFPQALPMCGSLLFPELPSTSVGNAVAAPPVLAALFPPPHSSNTAYHSALYSTSGGVLDCGALDGTFSVLPHHQSPSPVLFPTPASYDLDNYRTGAQEGSCYPRFNGGYGAHEEGRRDGILGWGSAPQNRTPVRAPVLDLPILQPSPAVSSSHNQEAWWKRRCLCVTCKALPDSRNEDFSAGEGEMLPTVHTKAGGVKSSQGHRKATQEPFSIPEGSTWDELVWRWLKQLGMENEVEEILCPGAQRVLVMWSSDQAAEHWRAKMGVTAFNASQLVVFENTLLKWS